MLAFASPLCHSPPSPALLAVRVAVCPIEVSLPLACRYVIPCGLCVPRAPSGRPSGPRRLPVASVCACAPAAFAPPPCVDVARAPRAVLGQGGGRAAPGGLYPFRVPCPGPVLCLVSSGGGGLARSLRPLAWLWVACPLVGGPVCPGKSGARGVWGWGGPPSASPRGRRWVRVGRGVSGGRGRGGCSASVRPSATLVQAPRRASLASFSPWRVWSPYCSSLCPRAPVRVRPEGGTVVPPGVSAGGWRAGWQASQGNCGSGRVMVRGRAACGPSSVPSAALGPGCRSDLGGEGCLVSDNPKTPRLCPPLLILYPPLFRYFVFQNKSSCHVPRNLKSLEKIGGLGAFFFWFFASNDRK